MSNISLRFGVYEQTRAETFESARHDEGGEQLHRIPRLWSAWEEYE